MRELKFRYTYQHQETGRVMSKCYTLTDIEQGCAFDSSRWILIARDQYVGLADKHNKDIYEGDIVRTIVQNKYLEPEILKVEWEFKGFVLNPGNKGFVPEHFEIIGDIYSNPELLNKEK